MRVSFEYPDLPITQHRVRIAEAMQQHQVVVIVGETGSGKTTQLPKIAYELAGEKKGKVGCTQPRRLAAATVARRIAEEVQCELGDLVGYQVRFEDKTSEATRIKLMTDGILLAETQADRDLRQYHTIILDEAHERSLNIDFLLGYMKLLLKRRKDLRLVISSATMDAGSFSEFFDDAPVISVEGRSFPVDILHLPPQSDNEDLSQHVARAVQFLDESMPAGDVLVFLPGEREIMETAEMLEGRRFRNTSILPLYARMAMGEQQRIFQPHGSGRRIVLATNVAETSLTIPRIAYVIDSGLARMSRYSPARQVQRLQIEEISLASARQRSGRCGRICAGTCIRLYDEENEATRADFTDPEIRRSSLAGVILRMADLKLPPLGEFPLPDPPSPKLINEGYRTLREIGAMDRQKALTPLGRELARMPIDPRLARMLAEAKHEKALPELIVIVAGLSIMDPRERPSEKAQQADAAHARWRHDESDFLGILALWRDIDSFREGRKIQRNALRKFCGKNFLNFNRSLEWLNLHGDISRLLRQALSWDVPPLPAVDKQALSSSIHRSILAGAPLQFGIWRTEEKCYRGAAGRSFSLFPGSTLFKQKQRPEWVMGVELVETTRLWMRRCAKLDPTWVEQVAPQLCECQAYGGAWDAQQGAVYGKERVMCGGLTLIEGRRIHYGRRFPAEARTLMIREGLLTFNWKGNPIFLQHLRAEQEEIQQMEAKLRRPNQIWYEDGAFRFFDQLIPVNICTQKALQTWKADDDPELIIPRSDLMYHFDDEELLAQFPDVLEHEGVEYSVYYQYAPGEGDDGVTLGVHIEQLGQIPDWLPEWGVQGNLAQRAECLMRTAPKEVRQFLQPFGQQAQAFAEYWDGRERNCAIAEAISRYIESETRRPCAPEQIDLSRLPAELVTKIWICDDDGNELAMGTHLDKLRENLQRYLEKQFKKESQKRFHQRGMTDWSCGTLPAEAPLGAVMGYPALSDEGTSVSLNAYPSREQAEENHRLGCARLASIKYQEQVNHLKKRLPLSLEGKLSLASLGASPQYNLEDFLLCAVEGSLGSPMPRSVDEFAKAGLSLRENLFEAAKYTASVWELLAQVEAETKKFIAKNTGNRYTQKIADDLSQQLSFLFRERFLRRAGFACLSDLARYMQGILERMKRIDQQPLARELERIARYQATCALYPEPRPLEFAYLLEEYRLTLFAPNIPTKTKISEKILEQAWARN